MKLDKPNLFAFLGWNTQGDLGPYTFYTKRKHTTVFFLKAPPLEPASPRQIIQRSKFRLIAKFWKRHTDAQRAAWERVTKVLRLNLTGYNLFMWYYTNGDRATLATIERLSSIQLIQD